MKAVLVAVSALIVVAGAAAAGPAVKLTAAGRATANASRLTVADLGKGWTSKATNASPPILGCKGFTPSFSGLAETGVASSPTFAATASGPFIVQQTIVFDSAAQASSAWQRAVKPALATCAAQTLGALATNGIKVAVTSRSTIAVAKATPHTAAYRVVATLTSKTQKVKDYFDVIYVSSGSALSAITVSSFVKPVPKPVESALAKIVANRLAGNTA